MSTLHPHWNATDADAQKDEGSTSVPVHGKSVSRLPAALLGMFVAGTVGMVFLGGVENLRGQLLSTSTIVVNPGGLDPQVITVAPGTEIAWESRDSLPHVFQSETLCDDNGVCLETDLLFENETIRYTIPLTTPFGLYQYASTTAPDITGEIIVSKDAPVSPPIVEEVPVVVLEEDVLEEIPAIAEEPSVEALPDTVLEQLQTGEIAEEDLSYIQQLLNAATQQDVPLRDDIALLGPQQAEDSVVLEGVIPSTESPLNDAFALSPEIRIDLPRNPYVVGTNNTGYTPPTAPTADILHAGAPELLPPPVVITHTPLRQPETGATFWFVLLFSIAGLLLWLKRHSTIQRLVSRQ